MTNSIPIIFVLLHRQFLPQAGRYRPEMELGVALLGGFGARAWFEKMPVPVKRAAIFLVAALAIEQIVFIRDRAKIFLAPADVTKTVEYRASMWTAANLPGVRVMFPGSIAQWATAFSDIPQFSGSSWSIAYNHTQQRGLEAIYKGGDTAERDARVSLAWLKAFGAGAVAISSPDSEEFWKGFAHPSKFDGVLQTLWSESRRDHRQDSAKVALARPCDSRGRRGAQRPGARRRHRGSRTIQRLARRSLARAG